MQLIIISGIVIMLIGMSCKEQITTRFIYKNKSLFRSIFLCSILLPGVIFSLIELLVIMQYFQSVMYYNILISCKFKYKLATYLNLKLTINELSYIVLKLLCRFLKTVCNTEGNVLYWIYYIYIVFKIN